MNIHEINNLRNALDSVTKKEMEQRKTIKRLLLEKEDLKKQLDLCGVVKSLPTEECVRDWWKEGVDNEHFWKHEINWTNEQVFTEIYQSLIYFINKWQ